MNRPPKLPDLNFPREDIFHSFHQLMQGRVPINTIIDVGCGDGNFTLKCRLLYGKHIRAINIEAQPVYEPSLRRIKEKTGTFYKITAVTPAAGRIHWTTNADSPYWSQAGAGEETVPAQPLDEIVDEFPVFGPYFIKMDIEGAELEALLGAQETLSQTSALMLECGIWYGPKTRATFTDLNAYLQARNFSLFDITGMAYRNGDAALFQIYATWLNRAHEFRHLPVPEKAFTGNTKEMGLPTGDVLTRAMQARREKILQQIEKYLELWAEE